MTTTLNILVAEVNKQKYICESALIACQELKKNAHDSEEQCEAYWNAWEWKNKQENVLRCLRSSLYSFRQAMGHENISSFQPEIF